LSAVDSAHDELAFVSLRGEAVIDYKEILISTASCRPLEQTDHWKKGDLVAGERKLAWIHAHRHTVILVSLIVLFVVR